MPKNKILAVYPNLEDHDSLVNAFMDSSNDIICVTSVSEAVKLLIEQTFSLIFIDSRSTIGADDESVTALKIVSGLPVIVVNTVVHSSRKEHSPQYKFNTYHYDENISHSGLGPYHQKILNFGELIIDPNRREVLLNGNDLGLTKIEFDIVYFLAQHKGMVMSRDQIYENVWTHDSSFDIDELVKAHIKRLRKKFSQSEHEYIQNVRGIGYKFCD